MRRGCVAFALVGLCLGVGACRESVAPPSAPPVPAAAPTVSAAPTAAASSAQSAAAHRVTLRGHVHADLPEMSFTLVADGEPESTGVLRVRAIEIRRGAAAEPLQRIDGLATETQWSADAPALELLDMNFDGYTDIRLAEARPAGPNVPYLNWLYDVAGGRFVASHALDAITSPRFDAAARELRSDWRDSAIRYGTDVYTFRDGQPVPVRREANEYRRAGVYTLQVSRWVDGAWKLVESHEAREP